MSRIDFTKELNAEQLAVVREGDGPCLVLAGAGSGKTRTIIYRVAYLIGEMGVNPENILLLTFTNKAAAEMTGRLRDLLGGSAGKNGAPAGYAGDRDGAQGIVGLWSGTFHSVANRILRAHAALIGHTPHFSILDQDDSKTLIKACLKEAGVDKGKGKDASGPDGRRFPSPAVVQEVISFGRNAGLSLSEALEKKNPNFLPLLGEFSHIAEIYARKKRDADAMDFDDLLVRLLELLDRDLTVRQRLQRRFRHILVDEYQDTNFIQSAIVSRLAGADEGAPPAGAAGRGRGGQGPNVLAVGDDAQSIYSFRAADIRNILDFPRHFPGARIFKLTVNYRSTPQILDLANEVITHNAEQFHKELSAVKPPAEKPVVTPWPSASQEAKFIADKIEEVVDAGVPASEIAVLFRATFHSQMLEFELMRRGIEYEYRGGLKFFERAHVKDVLSFLRVRLNSADEAAWLRLLTMQEGIGDVSAGRVAAAIRELSAPVPGEEWSGQAAAVGGGLGSALMLDVGGLFGNRVGAGWSPLHRALEAVHAAGDAPAAQIRAVLKSPYVDYLESEYPNFRERLEDLEQMARFAERYAEASEFLAEVALDDSAYHGRDSGPMDEYRRPRPILSTVHQAKGLEWDTVFVIHLTATSFPNRNAMMEEGGLEEERRLFYVAVTRAKRLLFLSHPATVGRDEFNYEGPSRFLEEVDPNCVEAVEPSFGAAAFNGVGAGGFYGSGSFGGGTVFRRGAGGGGGGQRSGKPRSYLSDVGGDADYSQPAYDSVDGEEVIELDDSGERVVHSMREIRERVKKLKAGEWKKKSFLGDV